MKDRGIGCTASGGPAEVDGARVGAATKGINAHMNAFRIPAEPRPTAKPPLRPLPAGSPVPEPSVLTPEELRRIVLEIVG